MSKKPERKKKTKSAGPIHTSLRACYFRLIAGVILLVLGGLLLMPVFIPEGQSRAVDGLERVLYGLGGGNLALFLPLWLILLAALLLTGMFHRVSARSVFLTGAIWALTLGFFTLVTVVDNRGTNVMANYRDTLAGREGGAPGFADFLALAFQYGADSHYCQGAVGMLVAYPIWCFFRFSHVGGSVFLGALILVLVMVLFDIRPWRMINAVSYKMAERRERARDGREVPVEPLPEEEEDAVDDGYPIPEREGWPAAAPVPAYAASRSGGAYAAPKGPGYDFVSVSPGEPSRRQNVNEEAADEDGYYRVSGESFYNEFIPDDSGNAGPAAAAAPREDENAVDPPPALPADRPSRKASPARNADVPKAPEEETMGRVFDRNAVSEAEREAVMTVRVPAAPAALPAERPSAPETPGKGSAPGRDGQQTERVRKSEESTPRADRRTEEGSSHETGAKKGSWLDQVRGAEKRLKEEPAENQKTEQVVRGGAVPVNTGNVLESDVRVPIRQNARNAGNSETLDGMERGRTSELEIDTRSNVNYQYPPLTLLNPGVSFNTMDHSQEDNQKAVVIEETLKSFSIPAEVKRIMHGPAITRFAIQIAPGIRVQKVTGMADNLALNLATRHVRVEAPIQGTNYIGIEVPNNKISKVSLREVLESEQMRSNPSPLAVSLGKDIAGAPVVCDLSQMPHLLIAGATGSGKSVCIHSIVCSILARSSPQDVRLIMIDPKQVELSVYNGVPHLLIPVVTDVRKASGALGWAVQEMHDRYSKFKDNNVRNLEGYNRQHLSDGKKLPNIVLIIDEMADLMDVCRKDVEEYIRRLAALARAAGIYMVLATQRPSVDVITGVIKNNIPSRIAFAVSSGTDSRTILDSFGAEKLMGKGDMLYKPSGMAANRVQGSFVSDDEVMAFTDYIRSRNTVTYDQDIMEHLTKAGSKSGDEGSMDMSDGGDDEVDDGKPDSLLEEAIQMAIEDGQTSTSMLQRRLRIGYARAGRLVDEMERRGVVSAQDGSKPRKTLITREQYYDMFSEENAGE
ncbi:MAG: DUF87 domain-containing protein [Clostridia bacterium]|nr:DUF87 domain-containing protein [Clostridia bacterium]